MVEPSVLERCQSGRTDRDATVRVQRGEEAVFRHKTAPNYNWVIETLTFLNTDIEGSTALLRRVGDATYGEILSNHHRIIREALERHHGREDGTAGDSFFAVFTSPRECIAAVVDMQRALHEHSWIGGETVRVRMGVHTGEVSTNATGFVGYEVHRAARISSIGHGGQVLISTATATLITDGLPEGVALRELGAHRLKDLGRPEVIFQLDVNDLPQNFPPLRSLDNPELPNNLPTSLNHFIGRDKELTELRDVTRDARLVTLTGAGGSGKTRLALQSAAELLDHQGDGVWFIELAPINDPEGIAPAVANAMDMSYDSATAPTDALLQALKDQAVILVVDNCEHLVEPVADLIDAILRGCPKVKILATSREPLGVMGEVVYRVRSLSLPTSDATTAAELANSDSVQLFTLRAQAMERSFSVTDDNAQLVASICRRLDGIPLAIELAAARLSSMSIENLNERLDQRFRLLTGGSRNALPRQQTLGAMVAWSYDLLNPQEQQVLRRLTVFLGSFDLAAAEAVASCEVIDEWEIADILGSLVNKSLVIGDHYGTRLRYRVLETIRQYGADQLLQVDGEEAMAILRRRHADYYLALCERLSSNLHRAGQVDAFAQLDYDRENIEAALSTFRDQPEGAKAILRLCAAINTFALTRNWHEFFEFLAWAIAETNGEESLTRARGLIWHLRREMHLRFSENLRPLDYSTELTQIITIAEEHNDLELRVMAMLTKANLLQSTFWEKASPESFGLAKAALELAEASGDAYLIGSCQVMLARLTDDPAEKKAFSEQSLVSFRKTDSPVDICASLVSIGTLIDSSEPDANARRIMLLQETLTTAERVGDATRIDQCVTYLGMYLLAVDDFDESERYCRLALSSCIRLGRGTAYFGWLALLMGRLSAELGHAERATTLLGWMLKQLPDTDEMFAGSWLEEERQFARDTERLSRAILGDARYDELFSQGASMTTSQAIDVMRQPS